MQPSKEYQHQDWSIFYLWVEITTQKPTWISLIMIIQLYTEPECACLILNSFRTWVMGNGWKMQKLTVLERSPLSLINVWSDGGRLPLTDPAPSVQSKLSARECFQPQRPFSKEQDIPQFFSSVPSPQSSTKSQACLGAKSWPLSQGRESEGRERASVSQNCL